jgi:hypothetical protein
VYLAYKYVAIACMLAEVNFTASRLGLPQQFPISEADLRYTLVSPPSLGFVGGRISTDQWTFAFSENGRLQFIWELQPFNDTILAAQRLQIIESGAKSLINEKEAHQIATNWLAQIFVDVHKLESKYPPRVSQEFIVSPSDRSKKDLLPLFKVKWGPPKVDIEIDGRTKTLLQLRLEDDSYSTRPIGLIKNLDELLKIRDEEFLNYSDQQKKDLVQRFAIKHYDLPTDSTNKSPPTNQAVPATIPPK